MTNILNLLLTTILIFGNFQGQSPGGTVPLFLGSTNVVTDEAGSQVKYIDYKPYGDTKLEEGSLKASRKFTGKELDDSTGLYDYAARQYDARIGRFISADTIDPDLANPQSLNRYSYTLNNPLKYTDPSGHSPLAIAMFIPGAQEIAALVTGYLILKWSFEQLSRAVETMPAINLGLKLPGFDRSAKPPPSVESPTQVDLTYKPEGMRYTDVPDISVMTATDIKVRHYTDKAGKQGIVETGKLKRHSFVTKPGEIPKDATRREIENKLGIEKGRGKYNVDLKVRKSDLYIPGKQHGGETTKGGAWQRRLKRDYPVEPEKFK